MNKPKADWLGWWIQFIFGFVVGVIIGFVLSCGKNRCRWWSTGELALYFIIGAGLLVGAIATQKGDRLWLGGRYTRFLPTEEIDQTDFSRLCSILIGIAGAGMMIYAILVTMKVI